MVDTEFHYCLLRVPVFIVGLTLNFPLFLAIRCRISGVPDSLRESLDRLVEPPSYPTSREEGEGRREPSPEVEHPYEVLSRSRIDFESYVLLLQVGILWGFQV